MSQKLKEKINLLDGIVLATGSIIGSGVLFLPSLTFALARADALVVWGLATCICVPLLIMFSSMVVETSTARGVEEIVSAGLGPSFGASIPLLFLGTVCFGIPSSAIIAGKYAQMLIGVGGFGSCVASMLILVAIISSLAGKQLGTRINLMVALCLLAFGVVLIAMTTPPSIDSLRVLIPRFSIRPILAGTTAAFWAYAGFENLSFIAGEFEKPKRDFFISVFTALLICCLIYVGLTVNFSAWIGNGPIRMVTGLAQLSDEANLSSHVGAIIALFAIFAVQINLISWIWGISRLVSSSGKKGYLPRFLGNKNSQGTPINAILCLGFIFLFITFLASMKPGLLEKFIIVVSTNFIFIYIICILSYIKFNNSYWKKSMACICLILLSLLFFNSRLLVSYPIAIFALGSLIHWSKIKSSVIERIEAC